MNKTNIFLFTSVLLAIISSSAGCAMNSTYSNTNNGRSNNVTATGSAAVEAARANTSHTCQGNCLSTRSPSPSSSYRNNQSFEDRAVQQLGSSIINGMNRSLNQAFNQIQF